MTLSLEAAERLIALSLKSLSETQIREWFERAARYEEWKAQFERSKAMFEVGKTYKTRDGRDARVICTDRRGDYPVVALVLKRDGIESCYCYSDTGMFVKTGSEYPEDLIPPLLPITPGRYKTRDGSNARVFCTDAIGVEGRVYGLLECRDGIEHGQRWFDGGNVWKDNESLLDLVERIGDL